MITTTLIPLMFRHDIFMFHYSVNGRGLFLLNVSLCDFNQLKTYKYVNQIKFIRSI